MKFITYEVALSKAMKYCAYQERANSEVMQQLKKWNTHPNDLENIISQLQKDNFLDEERFLEAFINGKFRYKKWGKLKIRKALLEKRIASNTINIHIDKHISFNDYKETLNDLIKKKRYQISNKELSDFQLKEKISRYLLSKGFEKEIVLSTLFADH